MTLVLVLLPFVLLGIAVIFISFSGGPAAAREAYLTRGNRAFRVAIPILYLLLGVAVPAAVIASRGEREGGRGRLRDTGWSWKLQKAKELSRHTCAPCHNLDAV